MDNKNKITLGLSQIFKNEGHILERYLNTIKDICDYYTFVDTGSTDNSVEIIEKWMKDNNITNYQILHRPFDNFENSRNYAMQMAKDKTDYSFWMDCDEELILTKDFDKNKLDKDLYMGNTHLGLMQYTRNQMWSNKKDFRWYGPVHEFITPVSQNTTNGVIPGWEIKVHTDGGSWKYDEVHMKYWNHAKMFEDYLMKDRDPRWVFYTAQSYHDSSNVPNNREESEERLRRSLRYYQERVTMMNGFFEEIYYAQLRVGTISMMLDYPWLQCKEELMKAYSIDPLRGESFKPIIEYYQQAGEWEKAYVYSTFAYKNFHDKNPYNTKSRMLFVDESVYVWRFLELHAMSALYTNRKIEAKDLYAKLFRIVQKNPMKFHQTDIQRILNNKQIYDQA